MPGERGERDGMWIIFCISLANQRSVRNEIKENIASGLSLGLGFKSGRNSSVQEELVC